MQRSTEDKDKLENTDHINKEQAYFPNMNSIERLASRKLVTTTILLRKFLSYRPYKDDTQIKGKLYTTYGKEKHQKRFVRHCTRGISTVRLVPKICSIKNGIRKNG